MALLTILVILMGSIQETCRQQATLHALTDKRLLSLGPSADGLGVSFQQFDGAVVKDAADSAGYRGYSGPVFPLRRIVAPACPSRFNSSRFTGVPTVNLENMAFRQQIQIIIKGVPAVSEQDFFRMEPFAACFINRPAKP